MSAVASASQASEPSLERLASELERLEAIASGWDSEQTATTKAIKQTVEEIFVETIKRLIRGVKAHPQGLEALKGTLNDEWVRTVLMVHGILRAPDANTPEQKVHAALQSVRPLLASHGGDVKLEALREKEVEIQLLGNCDGCSQSSVTVKMGIETAIREALPSIERVLVKEGAATHAPGTLVPTGDLLKKLRSPFEGSWEDAGAAQDVPSGSVMAVELQELSVLLTRLPNQKVVAYPNACTHLGMPLDTGSTQTGPFGPELECRYHGFRYRLDTGECLTAPEVALPPLDVRENEGRIFVRVSSGGRA